MFNLRALFRHFALFAVALMGFILSAPAHADALDVTTCSRKVQAGEAMPRQGGSHYGFDCSDHQKRQGPGDFWVSLGFAPVIVKTSDPLVLRTTSVWQDSTTLHFLYADGKEAVTHFNSADAHRFLTIGAIFEYPIPAHDAALTSIIMRTENSANLRGVVLGAKLMPQSESTLLKMQLTALYAAFAGMSLALIVYNLALWFALRHRFQLLYCFMVVSILIYAFSTSGASMLFFPGLDNNVRLRTNYLVLAVAAIAALQFIRYFFEDRVIGPKLAKSITIASIWAGLSALAFALLAPWQITLLDVNYFASFAVLVSLLVPLLISAWRRKSDYFWLFLMAWSAQIITSALRALHGLNIIPYSFLLDNGTFISLAVEALLSSVMITQRVRRLSIERDHARTEERSARRLAATDALTGLLNRGAFLEEAIGKKGDFALLLMDIDHFKRVNDSIGHGGGDTVLCEVADMVQAFRPHGALAARLGGEEFALLMPLSHETTDLPQKILTALRQAEMPCDLRVTASIGVAEGEMMTEADWKRLYHEADAALYRAKKDGRDRACRATRFQRAA